MGEGEALLLYPFWRRGQRLLCAGKRRVARGFPALLIGRKIDNKQLRHFFAAGRERIANKRQPLITDPPLFIRAVDLITAGRRRRRRAAHQHAPVAAAIFTRIGAGRRHRAKRHRDANVAQIQRRVALMHDVIVIGKANVLPVRAKDMHVRATAQRAGRVGRGDIERIKIGCTPLCGYHAATMVEIVLPRLIRIFRTVNKHILLRFRVNGHHADMRAIRCGIDHLNVAGVNVDAFDGFAGKGGAGGAHIEHQPLAVRRPGVDIGQLVIARGEGELFHESTLKP